MREGTSRENCDEVGQDRRKNCRHLSKGLSFSKFTKFRKPFDIEVREADAEGEC